jgi:hypothetical protein
VWKGKGISRLHLQPGQYHIEAKYGLAKISRSLTVRKGKRLAPKFVLNAGTVYVKAQGAPGRPPLKKIVYVIRKAGAPAPEPLPHDPTPKNSAPDRFYSGQATEAVFHVPAGAYTLYAFHGGKRARNSVNVEAGNTTHTEIVTNTSVLKISARAVQGGAPLDNVTFVIYDDKETLDRREIARSEKSRSPAEFVLPAGAYRVVTLHGLVYKEQRILLAAGDEKNANVVLKIGSVQLTALLAGNGRKLEKSLYYKIYTLSNPSAHPLFSTSDSTPTVFLKQGRYRIESQYGPYNVRQVREVNIPAGKTVDVSFKLAACAVTLKLLDETGKPLSKVKWTLRYSDGGTVLISQDAMPQLILQTGNYQVKAQHHTKTFSRTFEAMVPNQVVEVVGSR